MPYRQPNTTPPCQPLYRFPRQRGKWEGTLFFQQGVCSPHESNGGKIFSYPSFFHSLPAMAPGP